MTEERPLDELLRALRAALREEDRRVAQDILRQPHVAWLQPRPQPHSTPSTPKVHVPTVHSALTGLAEDLRILLPPHKAAMEARGSVAIWLANPKPTPQPPPTTTATDEHRSAAAPRTPPKRPPTKQTLPVPRPRPPRHRDRSTRYQHHGERLHFKPDSS